jgi:hypothetical protein
MKPFTRIAVVVLSLVALLHLLRFAAGWGVTVNGAIVPVWVSGIAFLFAALVAFMVCREARRQA